MSRPLYVVPGILGSQLLAPLPPFGVQELWLSYARLALGEFQAMTLAPDGVSPHPEFGLPCTPALPLPGYYTRLAVQLQRDLPTREVIPWGYDWRLRLETTGEQLAEAIRARASPAEPAEVVAHSQGGLLARVMWRSLVRTGQTSLVRRIVSLGTPWNDGSYAVAVLWSYGDPQFIQLYAASSTVATIRAIPFFAPGFPSLSGLVKVTATWPAIYELLPPPVPFHASPPDPARLSVYAVSSWPADRGISETHLAHAAGPWRELLNDPASTPPPDVLTVVAGTGYETPVTLDRPELLGEKFALGTTTDGDGRVSSVSALGPGGAAYAVQSGHGDLIENRWILENVSSWVDEVRAPAPPPEPETIGRPEPLTMTAPLGFLNVGYPDLADC